MRDHAMDFYTDLFGGEQCSIEGREEILEGLPQLSPEEKAALDLELTLEELTGAVNQMASGRAPGIDGLSGEFLKHFGVFLELIYMAFSQSASEPDPSWRPVGGRCFPCCQKKETWPY
ncbi:hypothetical protein NHX12_014943 [Muraenolepis orangiensis]|uniref:Uncharacterized protein n=1 Tax=Muraenolepis orangiensis TaxID=630683 RepID=A0A9Q0DB95_9TELE|nr:hypothetical protein NHX12_014943 [Muraenolepis orangiensis]